jgi:hypothetical protein
MSGKKHDFEPEELAMIEDLGLAQAPSGCPTPARIQAYAIHALPDEQIDRITRHLADCPLCRLLADDFSKLERPDPDPDSVEKLWRRMQPAMRDVQPKPPARRRWSRLTWALAPMAAAALLVFTVRAPAPRPTISAVAARQDLKRVVPIEPAPVVVAIEDLLTWRGAETNAAKPDLAAAFIAYRQGNYVEAARRFGALASRDPRNYQAAFYHGVALLLADRPAEAVAPLERAKTFGGAAESSDAQWYLGLALIHAGELDRGRRQLDELCLSGAGRAADACLVLRRAALLEAAPKHN